MDCLPQRIGLTPDLGHIVRGGMDPLEIISTYRERVDYVHIKDITADGIWSPAGAGVIDIRAVVRYLADTGYIGWITMEDELPEAERDPDAAVLPNGEYAQSVLAPVTA